MPPPPAALTIRRATPKDAAAITRIMGDPAVYPGLLQMPYADEERQRAWLAEMGAAGKADLALVAERGGTVVGSAGLHPAGVSARRRHAVYFGISVAAEAQRQGVGKALMQAICDYADRWIGALRIELTVFADNAPAIALYRRFGFVVEGTMRAYALRDGRYEDGIAMVRFHPNPPALPPVAAPVGR